MSVRFWISCSTRRLVWWSPVGGNRRRAVGVLLPDRSIRGRHVVFRQGGAWLTIGWIMGVITSMLGMYFSVVWDLPTGATIVCTFGAALILMAAARPRFARDALLRSARIQLIPSGACGRERGALLFQLLEAAWMASAPLR